MVASGLVDGQIVLHRYTSNNNQQPQPQPQHDEDDAPSTSSYSASQVFVRSSKKGASCRAVAFAPDGQTLLAGFATGTLLQLDAETGKVLTRLTKAHKGGINRMLALGLNATAAAGAAGHQQQQQQPALFAVGDDGGGLSVWDLRSQSAVYQYSKHTDYISGLAQHSRGQHQQQQQDMLVAVSGDGTLSVHDLRGGKVVARSETDADDELLSGGSCLWFYMCCVGGCGQQLEQPVRFVK